MRLAIDIDDTIAKTAYWWAYKLIEKFGTEEDLAPSEIINRYGIVQNVPFWGGAEFDAWIEKAKCDEQLLFSVPPFDCGKIVLQSLSKNYEIACYLTARDDVLRACTESWLCHHKFPDAPVVLRPQDVPHKDRNKWKARCFEKLGYDVLIDDQIELAAHLQGGTLFHIHPTEEEQQMILTAPHRTFLNWDELSLHLIKSVIA